MVASVVVVVVVMWGEVQRATPVMVARRQETGLDAVAAEREAVVAVAVIFVVGVTTATV